MRRLAGLLASGNNEAAVSIVWPRYMMPQAHAAGRAHIRPGSAGYFGKTTAAPLEDVGAIRSLSSVTGLDRRGGGVKKI